MDINERVTFLNKYGYEVTAQDISENANKRVIVGMSGGVDSSVTALLVKLLGYETIGIFMKNWDETDDNGKCSAQEDYDDVRKVCEQIDIPYYAINFVKEYEENVFTSFLKEYKMGHTPNPDILCNREIKFKVFYDKARELGADYLATGHYCQVVHDGGRAFLKKGADTNKDQSYFLYAIREEVLKNVLFPIGHLEKKYVREIATDYKLATYAKKDSTGICFIGERNFKEFLSQYIDQAKGNFVELESGKVVGQHDGVCFYTPGQRKGLGLGGPGKPWFVVDKNVAKNEVYLVRGEEHEALYAHDLVATDLHWINPDNKIKKPIQCKIRYRQQDQECNLVEENGTYKVLFPKAQRAIAQRQSIVFYSDDICLGGGVIESRGQSLFEVNQLP